MTVGDGGLEFDRKANDVVVHFGSWPTIMLQSSRISQCYQRFSLTHVQHCIKDPRKLHFMFALKPLTK
jgi:hypothetical protein